MNTVWLRFVAVPLACIVFSSSACRSKASADAPFTADISIASTVLPAMTGKLYLSGNHLRVDWGVMADVFDLKTRKGWRTFPDSKIFMELGAKDLSTYAPEMVNGSICPHAEFPSSCKLVENEVIEGRVAKKWELYNPQKGFSVYYWTDEVQSVTLRMSIGNATTYQVDNVRNGSIASSLFELPQGYNKIENPMKQPGIASMPH